MILSNELGSTYPRNGLFIDFKLFHCSQELGWAKYP